MCIVTVILVGGVTLALSWAGSLVPRGDYALVLVTETNTRGLLAIPPEGDAPRAVALDERARTLRPLVPECAPDRSTRALVVYEVECAGVRVLSEAHRVRKTPWHFDAGGPVTALSPYPGPGGGAGPARAVDALGAPAGPAGWGLPLVDNTMRLYSARITISELARDGTVTLDVGGRSVSLKPGEAWTGARVRDGSAVLELSPGTGWETSLRRAFASGAPVTRLDVFNYGLWRKERVQECGY
ncbi:MAG: hypothetical protein HPY55_00220 [Firmicutes bacterium]|nr:hypothetical protein [Bacillota bacterium]